MTHKPVRHLVAVPDPPTPAERARAAEKKLLAPPAERRPSRMRKRTIKQWAKFGRVNPRRPSQALTEFENEVVIRKVTALCAERGHGVTADELCKANPRLFNPRYLGATLKRVSKYSHSPLTRCRAGVGQYAYKPTEAA